MTVTVTEKFQSRDVVRGTNPSAQLNFIIQGTDDYDAALTQLAKEAPTAFDRLHITQSLGTVRRYARPGAVAGNFMGAIGVTADSVEGVDITVPVYSFSEVHYKNRAFVDDNYKATLFELTGTVNNRNFRKYAAGELLYGGGNRGLLSNYL